MIEKNAKISVLRTMIGLGEEIEPHFIVPQNSVSNIRKKMGLSEQQSSKQMPALIPLENSLRSTQPATVKCAHCENMAKNFLYLESLIRNNYNPKSKCGLCYSSLKYLQYVNKSIMQVFGNFETIVQAGRAFNSGKARLSTFNTTNTRALLAKSPNKSNSKKNVARKRLKGGKVTRPVMQKTGKSVSNVRLVGGGKLIKSRSRHEKIKSKNKKAPIARLTAGVAGKRKKPVNIKLNGVKQKNVKSKRKRMSAVRTIHYCGIRHGEDNERKD
ncbi:uncharacterized protein LOC129250170 [Anastrepha obliqua]|uniref:uncharacterized protein LOC129250170 n=1 Tax=Anastrepha obliqua TaxID=95512 RepID=UPI0024093BA8|nr:uncharacterized protein LOC129250170 [Anastrepha obliqua]